MSVQGLAIAYCLLSIDPEAIPNRGPYGGIKGSKPKLITAIYSRQVPMQVGDFSKGSIGTVSISRNLLSALHIIMLPVLSYMYMCSMQTILYDLFRELRGTL